MKDFLDIFNVTIKLVQINLGEYIFMIKIILKSIVILTIIFSFTSCASSGVIPLDKGVYYISKGNARIGMGPPSPETITDVYKEANTFCKTKGKEVKRINNIYTDSGYGKTANFALEFSCIKN